MSDTNKGFVLLTEEDWSELVNLLRTETDYDQLLDKVLSMCPVSDPTHPLWDVRDALYEMVKDLPPREDRREGQVKYNICPYCNEESSSEDI